MLRSAISVLCQELRRNLLSSALPLVGQESTFCTSFPGDSQVFASLRTCCCVCVCVHACSVTQLFLTLCDPMDCSPPGSSVHGILQARVLEWVAVSSSWGCSQQFLRWQVQSFTIEPPGKPLSYIFADVFLFLKRLTAFYSNSINNNSSSNSLY